MISINNSNKRHRIPRIIKIKKTIVQNIVNTPPPLGPISRRLSLYISGSLVLFSCESLEKPGSALYYLGSSDIAVLFFIGAWSRLTRSSIRNV